MYCIDNNLMNQTAQLGYDTFVPPIPADFKILLAITWITLAIFYSIVPKFHGLLNIIKRFAFEIVDTFTLVFCAGMKFQHDIRLILPGIFGCLFFWQLYQNTIIRPTIVEDTHKPFQTIKEFVDAGYSFLDG